MDIRGAIRRHRGRAATVAVLGVAAFVFGMLWFTPWRLFTDETVNEAPPSSATAQEAPGAESTPQIAGEAPLQDDLETLAEGEFISLEHESRGRAIILEAGDGARFLRFEDFETSNGPDLVVYLSSKTPAGTDDWHGYDADLVDLGPLKGNVGDQNYEIPPRTDLDRYSTAVVWCRRFEVGFAAATLS